MNDLFDFYKNFDKCILCGSKLNFSDHYMNSSYYCDGPIKEAYEFYISYNELQLVFNMDNKLYIMRLIRNYLELKYLVPNIIGGRIHDKLEICNLDLLKFNNKEEVIIFANKLLANVNLM